MPRNRTTKAAAVLGLTTSAVVVPVVPVAAGVSITRDALPGAAAAVDGTLGWQ